jgi:O-antigen/teichoic acid export membrane protein
VKKSLKTILWEQRNSGRVAYALHMGTRLANAVLGLVWIRLLVGAMGQQLISLYLAFQNVVTLGGLGDLGMGGAVGIRTGQYLGQGKQEELKKFLASARAVFLILALTGGGAMLVFSPVLPRWLGFRAIPASGTVDFTTNDFINVPSLAARLNRPRTSDPVSAYVSAALSPETREQLSATNDLTNPSLRESLVADFNRISRDAGFYQPERFAAVRLSPETQRLLKAGATGEKALRLNRLLLIDAYPGELDRNRASGPLQPVFAIGALLIVVVLLSSYLSNLNYACGNVAWPVLPLFVTAQLTLLGQWLLARQEQPLWIQCLPAVVTGAAGLWLTWFYVRLSHRWLSNLLPLSRDWGTMLTLFESSFWIYLCSLGNVIYRSTDGLVINKGFKLGTLAGYTYNYKFCEMAVFLVLAASLVTLPKITQWMASPKPEDRERVKVEMRKLNQFQTLLGCGAALAYLGGNNLFMKLWWLHKANPILPAPLPLQLAFALNLAVTTSGDTGIQLALRSGSRGLRTAGMAIGLTGLLNLGLSIVAMKMGSLWGIAMATVLAQSVLSLVASYFTCSYLKIEWAPWALKGWLFPVAGIIFAGWLRMQLPGDSAQNLLLLAAAYAALLLAAAWALGVRMGYIKEELQILSKFFHRR